MELLHFHAVTSPDFRWVRCQSGEWRAFDPPSDWEDRDYEAAEHGLGAFRAGPVPTDEIYLAAPLNEKEIISCDKDLYLKVASVRPTPENIMVLVNRYGLLRDQPTYPINRKGSRQLQRLLGCDSGQDADVPHVEPVTHWLSFHYFLSFRIRHWANLKSRKSRKGMEAFIALLDLTSATLDFELRLDRKSGRVKSDLVARSLADVLKLQLGMDVAADALPRQCLECNVLFHVSPAQGRPEKVYCSAACKMRGWRRRSTVR